MKQFKIILALFFILSFADISLAQQNILQLKVLENGDSLLISNIPEIEVNAILWPNSRRQQRKLTKLIRNIKKVYPYAKLAGMKLHQYNDELLAAKNKKERKVILKKAEKEIQDKYGKDLRNMTFSQGRILIKLIDRETGNSSYELVSELKGKFIAFFWQSFARLFGYNLKIKYDPLGDDKDIETIVRLIEKGQL